MFLGFLITKRSIGVKSELSSIILDVLAPFVVYGMLGIVAWAVIVGGAAPVLPFVISHGLAIAFQILCLMWVVAIPVALNLYAYELRGFKKYSLIIFAWVIVLFLHSVWRSDNIWELQYFRPDQGWQLSRSILQVSFLCFIIYAYSLMSLLAFKHISKTTLIKLDVLHWSLTAVVVAAAYSDYKASLYETSLRLGDITLHLASLTLALRFLKSTLEAILHRRKGDSDLIKTTPSTQEEG